MAPLMSFENSGTLQKWQVTKTPPEIDKYETHKKWYFAKMTHLAKKCPKVTLFANPFLKIYMERTL